MLTLPRTSNHQFRSPFPNPHYFYSSSSGSARHSKKAKRSLEQIRVKNSREGPAVKSIATMKIGKDNIRQNLSQSSIVSEMSASSSFLSSAWDETSRIPPLHPVDWHSRVPDYDTSDFASKNERLNRSDEIFIDSRHWPKQTTSHCHNFDFSSGIVSRGLLYDPLSGFIDELSYSSLSSNRRSSINDSGHHKLSALREQRQRMHLTDSDEDILRSSAPRDPRGFSYDSFSLCPIAHRLSKSSLIESDDTVERNNRRGQSADENHQLSFHPRSIPLSSSPRGRPGREWEEKKLTSKEMRGKGSYLGKFKSGALSTDWSFVSLLC